MIPKLPKAAPTRRIEVTMTTPENPRDPVLERLEVLGEHLEISDEGSGPAVVAIAGLPGSARDWRWVASALAGRVRLIRLGMPGYGGARRRRFGAMTIERRGELALAALDALGIESAVWMGHSAGGATVAHVASASPERASAVAFIASMGPQAHYSPSTLRRIGRGLHSPLARVALNPLMRAIYTNMGFSPKLTDTERAFALLDASTHDFSAHAARVATLDCPCLVAYARDDAIIPVEIALQMDLACPPGPRLVFERGGHSIQKWQAVEIADAIVELTRHPEARPR